MFYVEWKKHIENPPICPFNIMKGENWIMVTAILASVIGALVAINTIIELVAADYDLNPPQQYVVAGPGYVQQAQPIVPSYPWGRTAYINTIANMPTVQTVPCYTPNYIYPSTPQYSYIEPRKFEYNVDYSGRGTVFNQPVQRAGPAAPPGYSYDVGPQPTITSSYPWNINPEPNHYNPWVTPTMQSTCGYNVNLSSPTPQEYARVLPDGKVTFCKIPSCYNDDGTWKY